MLFHSSRTWVKISGYATCIIISMNSLHYRLAFKITSPAMYTSSVIHSSTNYENFDTLRYHADNIFRISPHDLKWPTTHTINKKTLVFNMAMHAPCNQALQIWTGDLRWSWPLTSTKHFLSTLNVTYMHGWCEIIPYTLRCHFLQGF